MPTLTSRRIYLKPISLDDLDFLYALNTDSEVIKYIYSKPKTLEETQKDLEDYINYPQHYQLPTGLWLSFEKSTNAPIGLFVLRKHNNTEEFEIGYRLAKSFWYKGYATEGAKRLLDYALDDLDLKRIIAVVHVENTASMNVIQKLGFVYGNTGIYYNQPSRYYFYDVQNAIFIE